MRRPVFTLFAGALLLAAGAVAHAQIRVRTQPVRPPVPPAAADNRNDSDGPAFTGTVPTRKPETAPEIITDIARLPPAVARTRERILEAARSGRIEKLVAVMQSSEMMPIFSLNDEKSPLGYWKTLYPDSDGVEVLATMIDILEAGFIHVDVGTPQEMYLWPYFARMPLNALTPEQKVELFKIVTGADYHDMLAAGAYNFYRLGIGSDGAWHFFVAGD
jgi:hypothetical protein